MIGLDCNCLIDPRVRVKTYPVTIEGNQVVVEYDD